MKPVFSDEEKNMIFSVGYASAYDFQIPFTTAFYERATFSDYHFSVFSDVLEAGFSAGKLDFDAGIPFLDN